VREPPRRGHRDRHRRGGASSPLTPRLIRMIRPMIRPLLTALLVSALAATAHAGGQPDHPWPPDPAKFDPPGTEVAPGLKAGAALEQPNADKARALLRPESLKHNQDGGSRNEIGSWPAGIIEREKSFEEATRENAGRYAIDPKTGTLVEKATGKQP